MSNHFFNKIDFSLIILPVKTIVQSIFKAAKLVIIACAAITNIILLFFVFYCNFLYALSKIKYTLIQSCIMLFYISGLGHIILILLQLFSDFSLNTL